MKINNEEARKILKGKMNEELFIHSLGVEKTAYNLASRHGIDREKASLAGLLHDYAKNLPENDLSRLAAEHNLADDIILREPALLHAPVGAWLLEHELGIEDRGILEAVREHTTGSPGMSSLAKVVYLADCLEPGRNFPGLIDIRNIARDDLDRALFMAINKTLGKILDREKIIHPSSIFLRNSLLLSLKKNPGVNKS